LTTESLEHFVRDVESRLEGSEQSRLRPRIQAALDVVNALRREKLAESQRAHVLEALARCRSVRDQESVQQLQQTIASLSANAADLCRARGDLREAQSLVASIDRELKVC